jgi:hypothetical protein
MGRPTKYKITHVSVSGPDLPGTDIEDVIAIEV